MKPAAQIDVSATEDKKQQGALQHVQMQTKDELREFIARITAGVPVRRVEPAAADGLLSWGPTQSWTGNR